METMLLGCRFDGEIKLRPPPSLEGELMETVQYGMTILRYSPPPSLEGELMETPSETRTLNIRYSYPPPSLEGELMETFQPVRLVGLHKTAVKQV